MKKELAWSETEPPRSTERGYKNKGQPAVVDSGASWREFFRDRMPSMPVLPGSGVTVAKSCAQGPKSKNLKTGKQFLDEKGISLDL